MLKIQDFADLTKFETIISNWAKTTGLSVASVGEDGKTISDTYNFVDFSAYRLNTVTDGKLRMDELCSEYISVYQAENGCTFFVIELKVDHQTVGKVIGGQVFPDREDVQEAYVEILEKANVKDDDGIIASAHLLGDALTNFICYEYHEKYNNAMIRNMSEGVSECEKLVGVIQEKTKSLNSIQARQNILALNASIEAARAGDAGKGFAVVAKEVGVLSQQSKGLNEEISKTVLDISKVVHRMTSDEN